MSNRCMTAVFEHSQSRGGARLVLLAMADEANDEGLLTAYRRSQRWLAKKANCDAGTVRRAIEALVGLGEVVVLSVGDGRVSSDYRLALPGIEGVQDAPPAPAKRAPRGGTTRAQGVQDAPPIIPFSPGTSPVPLRSPAADEFERFWSAYPNKRAKPAALKAWLRALKRHPDPDGIISATVAFAADPNLGEPKFIPHASTWLNQDRWNDPPLPGRAKPTDGLTRVARRLMAEEAAQRGRPPLALPPPTDEPREITGHG